MTTTNTSRIEGLADIVRVHARAIPDQIALVDGTRTRTWAELYDRAGRVAAGLRAAGVEAGDRIAFLDKNSIEHFEIQFGAALLNAVCVDPNWRLAAPEVRFIVDHSESKVLITHREFAPILDEIHDQLPHVTATVVIDGHDHHIGYDAWLGSQQPFDPQIPSAGDDVAMQLYSSGTTGLPKGVMLSNDNILALLPLAEEIWELRPESVNLAALPLFHIGGGGWAIAGLYLGCKTVIVRDLDPAGVVASIEEHRVTHGFLVPALLGFLLFTPDLDPERLSSMEMVVYGASPITEDVLRQSIELFGCKFSQVYGLTETTGAVVILPPSDHDLDGDGLHRLRSCGLPGPGVEIAIADRKGKRLTAAGDVGEILVRSPQVMVGYWKQPEATAEAIDGDGWFRTGDIGYLDEDGYLFIHDRVKDMIVTGGENVYPAEVENALSGHDGIQEVAVIGVPDDRWGEAVKAIVVPAPGEVLDADDIVAFARGLLAGYKLPKSVDFVESLPRNATGKILKKDLREPFWAGRERSVN